MNKKDLKNVLLTEVTLSSVFKDKTNVCHEAVSSTFFDLILTNRFPIKSFGNDVNLVCVTSVN